MAATRIVTRSRVSVNRRAILQFSVSVVGSERKEGLSCVRNRMIL